MKCRVEMKSAAARMANSVSAAVTAGMVSPSRVAPALESTSLPRLRPRNPSALALAAFAVCALTVPAQAATVSEQKIAANNQLIALKKITVGPDDQYSAAVDPQRGLLVYVHKSDLVAHLIIHDLKTEDESDLLPVTADSQEPMFGPGGELAFTYFKFSARGDVCYFRPESASGKGGLKTAKDADLKCLKRSAADSTSARSNPFWKSADEIGYLERDLEASTSRIVVENIRTGKVDVLVKGSVWSPSMRAGGHLLAYNELLGTTEAAGWRTVIRDLRTSKSSSVHLALPGLSGFPIVSEDEQFLYFSHFMSDSNNDRTIDGSDNAVVFRLATAKILASHEGDQLMPEQLTASDSSCSFPRPIGDSVYATCAFEGSLDIYRMPLTGVVPANWGLPLLQNALQTSRAYAERILILNTIKARAMPGGSASAAQGRELDQALFFNHLMDDDTVAARFYLSRLDDAKVSGGKGHNGHGTPAKSGNQVSPPRAGAADASGIGSATTTKSMSSNDSFVRLTRILLQARELKKSQPVDGEIGREFRRQMLEFDQAAAHIAASTGGEVRFGGIVRGQIHADLQDWKEAESFFKKSHADKVAHPIERYFRFELARQLYERTLPNSLASLSEAYREMMAAPEFSEESQIFYAFNWVRLIAANEKDLAVRMTQVEKMNHGLPKPVETLLRAEYGSLKLVTLATDKEQLAVYRDLSNIMSDTRADYFLRKALYVRMILNFSAAANFKYLSSIAENWLKYTQKGDIEFSYAREVFADTSLDQGYGYLHQGKLLLGDNYFYASVMFTDDLESHYDYVTTVVKEGKRPFVDHQYDILKKQNYIDENMKFVDALLVLIDSEPKANKDPHYVAHLDTAIAKLESMTQNRDSATRELLLGYCYMEKMLREASGVEFSSELFESAHRNLMLAYDLGRDNVRIRVSALMDLGILHERAQNHGLAARFLALRKTLPFDDDAERAQLEWLLAHALDRSHQPEVALKELSSIAPTQVAAPITERKAFEAAMAGQYEEASALYERLFKEPGAVQGAENSAKINLMYGFALLRAGRRASATLTLKTALAQMKGLKVIKKDADHIVDFVPARLQLIATGLLAQAELDPKEQIQVLQERLDLLRENAKIVDGASIAIIQAHLQLAEAWRATDARQMKAELDTALQLAQKEGEANQYLSHAVFRTVVSYLSEANLQPSLFASQDAGLLRQVYEGCIRTYEAQKVEAAQIDYQKLKLQILWNAYSTKVLGAALGAPLDSASVMASSAAAKVKAETPEQWSELESLAAALKI